MRCSVLMMLLAPSGWLAGFSGTFVDAYGCEGVFPHHGADGFPVLLLIFLASRVKLALTFGWVNAPDSYCF